MLGSFLVSKDNCPSDGLKRLDRFAGRLHCPSEAIMDSNEFSVIHNETQHRCIADGAVGAHFPADLLGSPEVIFHWEHRNFHEQPVPALDALCFHIGGHLFRA